MKGNIGQGSLHFVAVASVGEGPAAFGPFEESGGEVCFSNAGFAADHDERTAADEGVVEGATEFDEFGLAPDQGDGGAGGGGVRAQEGSTRDRRRSATLGIATGGIFGKGAANKNHQSLWDSSKDVGRIGKDGGQGVHGQRTADGVAVAEEFAEENGEGKQVGALVEGEAIDLFGRQVAGCVDGSAGLREGGVAGGGGRGADCFAKSKSITLTCPLVHITLAFFRSRRRNCSGGSKSRAAAISAAIRSASDWGDRAGAESLVEGLAREHSTIMKTVCACSPISKTLQMKG